jgi:hypothetical protein
MADEKILSRRNSRDKSEAAEKNSGLARNSFDYFLTGPHGSVEGMPWQLARGADTIFGTL